MKAFSIVGWSGSGKTALITGLIEHFAARGRRVIAVKSTRAAYDLQPEGKDTARYLRAGAGEAYLVARKELLRMTALDSPAELLDELRRRLNDEDIVLLEGLTAPGIPVLEVQDPQRRQALKTRPQDLAAVVGAGGSVPGLPYFPLSDVAAIGAFLEECHGACDHAQDQRQGHRPESLRAQDHRQRAAGGRAVAGQGSPALGKDRDRPAGGR
ncbi:MAG: molybdopterin-guanine dinucleotide biosynthesis protein B [Candidatus Aminicenantes bacterium]|nr:molybdopterin-guanine dinucleotide biosynthesis protein B [Candidatus Aminicenantes bacterium]